MHSRFGSLLWPIHIVEYIESSSDKIAVLKVQPKKTIKTPTFEAEVYINLEKTYDILKITVVFPWRFKFVQRE